jgi:hypothetical protein
MSTASTVISLRLPITIVRQLDALAAAETNRRSAVLRRLIAGALATAQRAA